MQKMIMTAALVLGLSGADAAKVTVNFPSCVKDTTYTFVMSDIANLAKPRSERQAVKYDSVKLVNGVVNYDMNIAAPTQSSIILDDNNGTYINLFASPDDNLTVNVSSVSPLEYSVAGTPLMESVSLLNARAAAILNRYRENITSGNESGMEQAINDYNELFKKFIAANPNDPAAVYALISMDVSMGGGEDYLTAYNAMPESMTSSILYPIAVAKKASVEKSIEADKRMEALASGETMAPDFTLKNLEGKDVKLSDFRGKWVIIDFWGSWCGWCIKGFPKLKDAYEQYQPELEIIGVDCNEPEANWRKGVEKYQLPWVNVYNPEGSRLLADYGVQGFPTKVIVNPEGKIADITIGENPAFFDTLAKLINGK
ncbi:MAG: TlpA family protein disulfide reductase [Muribaculaceae bacterium]|nr:TlpA family protein disulfide reductase [Muribaculaceae bacterium]